MISAGVQACSQFRPHAQCFPRQHDLTTRALYLQQSGCVATWLICMLQNEMSATRAQELLDDAADAGVEDCQTLRRNRATTTNKKKNCARDLRARLLRGCRWPRTHEAQIRTWNPRRSQEVVTIVHMLLPHEVAHVLHNHLNAASMPLLVSTRSRANVKRGPRGICGGRWCSVQLGSLGVLGSICPEPSWAHCRSEAFAPASDWTVEQKRFHEYVRRCLGCRHMVVSMSGGWTTSVASTRRGTQGQTLGVQRGTR